MLCIKVQKVARATVLLIVLTGSAVLLPVASAPISAQAQARPDAREYVVLELMAARRVREQGYVGDNVGFDPQVHRGGQLASTRKGARSDAIAAALGARIMQADQVHHCPGAACGLVGASSLVMIGAPRIIGDHLASVVVDVTSVSRTGRVTKHTEHMHFIKISGHWGAVAGGLSFDS